MYLGVLSGLDENTIILGLLFIIFFVIVQLALSKSMKDKNSASIIALCVSLLSIYGLSKTGFDLSEFFYNFGISQTIIYTVIPIIILVGLIYLFWKVKVRFIFVVLGLILIVSSFFVFKKDLILIIGIGLLVVGIWLMVKESRRAYQKRQYHTFSK